VLIRQYLTEADIHPIVTGITFEKVWENKVKARFGKTFVWFASLNDLIKMKKAAGCPKDIEDLKYLIIPIVVNICAQHILPDKQT
jgi:hypothetical protein